MFGSILGGPGFSSFPVLPILTLGARRCPQVLALRPRVPRWCAAPLLPLSAWYLGSGIRVVLELAVVVRRGAHMTLAKHKWCHPQPEPPGLCRIACTYEYE
jgi:hypothetical protein